MSVTSEINSSALYLGDKNLGGFAPSAIDIDTTPLADLAKYTMLYNKAEYDQRQKDAEKRALELVSIAQFDFAAIDEKWRTPIAEKMNELTAFIRKNNNDVFNYQKNPDAYLEYQQKKADLNEAVLSGKANQVLLELRKTGVAAETNLKMKKVKEDEMNRDKAKTTLFDKMPIEDKYDIKFTELAKNQQLSFDAVERNPNDNTVRNYKVTDMGFINAQANLAKFEDLLPTLDKESDLFKNATQEQKDRMVGEDDRRKAFEKSGYIKMAEIAQDIVNNPKYLVDGKVSIELLKKDPNTANLAGMVISINEKLSADKARIKSGVFSDKRGNKIIFDNVLIKESDYEPINIEDGISAAEITKMMMISQAPAAVETTKIQETDDAIQNRNIDATLRGQDMDSTDKAAQRALTREGWARTASGGKGKTAGAATDTEGNDFDNISNHEYTDAKIVDGILLNNDGSVYTGTAQVPIDKVPKSILNTIKQFDKDDGYFIKDNNGKQFVIFNVVDGKFERVQTKVGGNVTRKNQISGQRSVDKGRKDETQDAFGANSDNSVNTEFAQ